MTYLQWMGLFFLAMIVIGMTFKSLFYFIRMLKTKKSYLRPLIKDFREKMWMTIGLGLVFFGFYLFVVLGAAFVIDMQKGLNFFYLLYAHPTEFIYLGMFIFAALSLAIYFVRMLIKYLYLNPY
ncbi:MAG: hypothetical protein H0V82_03670 [Candidatus Protochlamydia sp.]|nr:hypothetical protein [Candidatus Protochlamydia sp.]